MIPEIPLDAIIELLVMILAVTGIGAEAPDYPQNGTVTEVVDGDTIKVKHSYETYDVRLLGVDTPELNSAVHPSEFDNATEDCLRTYAETSDNYVRQELLGEEVQLEYDEVAGEEGDFGRVLAEVHYSDDKLPINKQILHNGYGRFYEDESYTTPRKNSYTSLEEEAKENKKGVWGGCQ